MADPHHEITALLYTYAERIDAGDFDGVGRLLGSAELTFEGFEAAVSGAEAISALYGHTTRRYEDDGTPKTRHLITNVVVELDGDDRATSRSTFVVLQAVPGALPLQPVIAGRYRHRFGRVDGRWRIEDMHIEVELVGELGHHLLHDPGL